MHWEILTRREISWGALEALQDSLAREVSSHPDRAYLLLSEPSSTFTFGRFASRDDLKWSDVTLAERGVSVEAVSRGGKWTYHGPGQVVAYPIVNLRGAGYARHAVRQFLEDFRNATLRALAKLGIEGTPEDEPFGIYVAKRKLVSFGISVERGTTRHGLALYVTPQTRFFDGIVACGQATASTTSLRELGIETEWPGVAAALADELVRGLGEKRVFLHSGNGLGSGPLLKPLI